MNTLWDLQDILDMEIHTGTVDTAKKDEENSMQTRKVGKNSSHRKRVNKDWNLMYLSLELQVHAPPVVYYPLNSDAHRLSYYI